MSKTITESQIIGQLGETMVKERALKMGFVFHPFGPPEAGIDGILEIRDPVAGSTTGQLVAVQVKTTARPHANETEAGFSYTMRKEDVDYWAGTNIPVILVLVHSDQQTAYWKHIEEGHGPARRHLRIDKTQDAFDESAREKIASLGIDRSKFGAHLPALNQGEKAHLNLLKVKFPETAYVGFSFHATGRDALFALLKREDQPPGDWVIRSRQFMSFRDPSAWPLSEIVDEGTVETIASQELAFPDDESQEHTFIDLLRRTLIAQLEGTLSFDRERRALYFPARPSDIERTYSYRSLKNKTKADVVKAYRADGRIKFVRHHAFESRFWRVDNEWFMSIAPTYHFTWDGVRPDKFASSRLSGKKQKELNSSLSGQLAMWRHLLVNDQENDAQSLFPRRPDGRPMLMFEALDPLMLERSVPEATWRMADNTNQAGASLFAEESQ